MIQPLASAVDDDVYEIVAGARLEKPMSVFEQAIAAILFTPLDTHCRANRLGRAMFETLFAMPESGNDRRPDVVFISFDRWPAERGIPRVNAWPIAPDLTVEVISPSDKAFDVIDKVHEYFVAGVRQVWHIYSNVEQIHVFTSPTQVQILARGDDLTGGAVVPGFRVPVVDLFPPAEEAP